MTALVRPDVRLHQSWAETSVEFDDEIAHGSGLWHLADVELDFDEAGCARVVSELTAYADRELQLGEDKVHCDYYWITDGHPASVIGFLALRHELNAWLLEEGGHLGFSVRPSRRGEGHASRALALAVRRSAELGLDRVLVTCDEDNLASRRTIEGNAGIYEDSRNGKRRYWITVTPRGITRGGTDATRP